MAKYPYNTAAWRTLRRAKLDASPCCEPCKRRGALVRANTVDHIVSIARGGAPFPPLGGLMSMCASCHGTKMRAIDRPGGSGIAFKGCDASGNPIDPHDPWWGADQDHGSRGLGTDGGSRAELVPQRTAPTWNPSWV